MRNLIKTSKHFFITLLIVTIVSTYALPVLASQIPTLVKNINTTPAEPDYDSTVYDTAAFSGGVFMSYYRDDGSDTELWKSDGTVEGTVMVKDINLSGDSNPDNFVVINDILYFSADDGVHGTELWKSDGTAEGTVMIKDIYASLGGSYSGPSVAMGNNVYFIAGDETYGAELWKSDGTEGGTVMVKDINEGLNGSIACSVQMILYIFQRMMIPTDTNSGNQTVLKVAQ
jgi:ELWxxDGT repeat protein